MTFDADSEGYSLPPLTTQNKQSDDATAAAAEVAHQLRCTVNVALQYAMVFNQQGGPEDDEVVCIQGSFFVMLDAIRGCGVDLNSSNFALDDVDVNEQSLKPK